MKIVFVCTGNTCRSPMAEAYLSKLLKNRDVEIKSAGINTVDGLPASKNTALVLASQGVNLDNHKSVMLDEKMVSKADLILTMTSNHKEYVKILFPKARDKVFTLKEFALDGTEANEDISDPFGQDKSVYENTFSEIKYSIDEIIKREKI